MPAERIPIANLKPGMYVLNPGISWINAPLLYMMLMALCRVETLNSSPYAAELATVSTRVASRGLFSISATTERTEALEPSWVTANSRGSSLGSNGSVGGFCKSFCKNSLDSF